MRVYKLSESIVRLRSLCDVFRKYPSVMNVEMINRPIIIRLAMVRK
jgi:hypothetical protein